MRKKLLLLWGMLLLCVVPVKAQSVISFMAGTFEGTSVTMNFTGGEAVSGVFTNSSINVTGGFGNGVDLVPTSNELLREDIPEVFRLNQNYPNPFNPSTNISFDLPRTSNVRLEVFNSIGARVSTLINEQKSAGRYTYQFEAGDLASGIYFYRLVADGNLISTQKMLLIK